MQKKSDLPAHEYSIPVHTKINSHDVLILYHYESEEGTLRAEATFSRYERGVRKVATTFRTPAHAAKL